MCRNKTRFITDELKTAEPLSNGFQFINHLVQVRDAVQKHSAIDWLILISPADGWLLNINSSFFELSSIWVKMGIIRLQLDEKNP